MDLAKSKRLLAGAAVLFWILAAAIYLIAGDQFREAYEQGEAPMPSAVIGRLAEGTCVTQEFVSPVDSLTAVELLFSSGSGTLHARLMDEAGTVLLDTDMAVPYSHEDRFVGVPLGGGIDNARGKTFTLELSGAAQADNDDRAARVYYGNAMAQSLFGDIRSVSDDERYLLNGEDGAGKLCLRASGLQQQIYAALYWPVMAGVFAVLALAAYLCWRGAKKGRENLLTLLCTLFCRYRFLVRQLVSRDFKKKYKRSVLGVAWSFLNPLLTMGVQYVVFSVVFRSNTPNYPLYLLTGVVLFNFFSESVSMGMNTILENANLIRKVDLPKYVFPMAKVLSTMINYGLSFIPIVLVMLFSGTAFRPSLLLLVYDSLCLMLFVMGMVLLMSTLKTFFVDMQFLWGVFQMMWMYLTPIFYPESIIPLRFLKLYHLNPMYQYINFARICIIDGRSPAASSYLWCALSAVAVLAVGALVFRRKQDRFVLYL